MQSSQGKRWLRIGVVVLHKGAVDAKLFEGGYRMNLGEPAPAVAEATGTDELYWGVRHVPPTIVFGRDLQIA